MKVLEHTSPEIGVAEGSGAPPLTPARSISAGAAIDPDSRPGGVSRNPSPRAECRRASPSPEAPRKDAQRAQGAASGDRPGRGAGAKASGRAQPPRTPRRRAARSPTRTMARPKGAEGRPGPFSVLPVLVPTIRVAS